MVDYEFRVYGYGRVSTKEQNEERQKESLKRYVPDERNIYIDKKSGKDFDRKNYQIMKGQVRRGDTLYIHELDRLGRNKKLILQELKWFQEHGVVVRILNVPSTLADYSALGDGSLQRSLLEAMNKMLIEVLAIMAEQERLNIVKRTREGLEVARAKGKRFGRPPLQKPETWDEDMKEWQNGSISAVSLYRDRYKMSKSAFYQLVRSDRQENKC